MSELLERVRTARRELAEHGPVSTRGEGDFERVALPDADGAVLRDLLVADRASTVVEIGLAYGSSALAIGEALVMGGDPGARHLAIDPWQTTAFEDAGWAAVRGAGLEGITTLIAERSQLVLPRLLADGLVAHAAFVDGSHHFHSVFVDLYFLGQIVRPGGLVVLDDIDWPSVATAVRYFERNLGWQPVPPAADPGGGGEAGRLAAYRLPDPPTEPSFEDFRPFG